MTGPRFSSDFQVWADAAGLTRRHALDAVNEPDQRHEIELEGGMRVRLFTKHVTATKPPIVVLAGTAVKAGGDEVIDLLFRVPADFRPNAPQMPPLDLLRAIAEDFGTDLMIGGRTTRKFFLQESVPLIPGYENRLFAFKQTQEVLATLLIRPMGNKVDCALAFAIDVPRYKAYLAKRMGTR